MSRRNKNKAPFRRTSIVVEEPRLIRFDKLISTIGVKRTTAINMLIEWAIQQGRLPSLVLEEAEEVKQKED